MTSALFAIRTSDALTPAVRADTPGSPAEPTRRRSLMRRVLAR
jgi:hypothetical protein